MHAAVLAAVTPVNTPHGSNMTAIFPVVLFVITAAVLYLRFRRQPQVPGHVALTLSKWVSGAETGADADGGSGAGGTSSATEAQAEPDAAGPGE